jgi:hypothetical protein
MAERFAAPVTLIRPFGTGHINDTYLAETPAGEYVVQRINTTVFHDPIAVTANILAVYRHLRGALMPEPVPTADGEWVVSDGSGAWRAWRRAPGEPRTGADAGPGALRGPARCSDGSTPSSPTWTRTRSSRRCRASTIPAGDSRRSARWWPQTPAGGPVGSGRRFAWPKQPHP